MQNYSGEPERHEMKGGARQGAGRKPGSPNKEKKDGRNVVKQIRWTEEEWQRVVDSAAGHQMTPSEFIRWRTL